MVTILLNYCGPKLSESEDKEMKAVIRDLVIILGYFCANNRRNQVNCVDVNTTKILLSYFFTFFY